MAHRSILITESLVRFNRTTLGLVILYCKWSVLQMVGFASGRFLQTQSHVSHNPELGFQNFYPISISSHSVLSESCLVQAYSMREGQEEVG